jgi:hypothetical protein
MPFWFKYLGARNVGQMLRSSVNLLGVKRRPEIKRDHVGDMGGRARWLRVRVVGMIQVSRGVIAWSIWEQRCF